MGWAEEVFSKPSTHMKPTLYQPCPRVVLADITFYLADINYSGLPSKGYKSMITSS